MNEGESARWLICPVESAADRPCAGQVQQQMRRIRLYCFPYSGGNAAAFVPWQREIDPAIELCAIQLPGRGSRFRELPCTSFKTLIHTLGDVLRERQHQHPLPFAFFGHSLGALVAFELARYGRDRGWPMPEHLIVSGCSAPPLREKRRNLHELPDAQLIEKLRDYNGTPREILDNPEFAKLFLPVVRADFALGADYQYEAAAPLEIPVTTFAGQQDIHATPHEMQEWQQHGSAAYQSHVFRGGHFFINEEKRLILDRLSDILLHG